MHHKIQGILFDLDETLLDRIQSLIRFCQWQATDVFHFNQDIAQHFIQRFIELDRNGSVWKDLVYIQLKQEFEIQHSVEELLDTYINQFQNFCITNPKVNETILYLHENGYKLGLISNGKSPFQEHNFQSLKLEKYFSTVIVSEAVNLRKPDPQIFHLACQQLGFKPEQCAFVGDNEIADVQGAKNAGLISIFYIKNNDRTSKYADQTIHHFSELVDYLS